MAWAPPFRGPVVGIGQPVTNGQTAFHFLYSYPANNYKLAEAHLVIDTSRDSSDTEGIFVDGVFSGRPPTGTTNGNVNPSCSKTLYPLYSGHIAQYPAASWTDNVYYMDWSMRHYKIGAVNTFDLLIDKLIETTPVLPVTTVDLVKDGVLPVVTGDDSPVEQAFLVLKGYTISKDPLTCVDSANYTFKNVFVHNDGNSIGQTAFTGTTLNPLASWSSTPAGLQTVEWYYDAQLPNVARSNITLTKGEITLTVKRSTAVTAQAAIVINGVAVAQTGFPTSSATSSVERWVTDAGQTYWENWVNAIPADDTPLAVTLNLVSLLGAAQLRDLIAQGKLNVAMAGSLAFVQATNNTSTRTFGAPVSGPELTLEGTYFTQLCTIPNNPSSPLSDDQAIPTDVGDHSSPVISSLQAVEITSNSAVVQWLTDEGATSRVQYGIGSPTTWSADDTTLTKFHRVKLTGLQPYKVYSFQVRTADGRNNITLSARKTFVTLR